MVGPKWSYYPSAHDTTNPKLAFAIVYEGELGETVSGGALAAPIAHGILKGVYDNPSAFAFAEPELTSPPVRRVLAQPFQQATARPVGQPGGMPQVEAQPAPIFASPVNVEPPQFPEKKRRKPGKSRFRGIFGGRQ